MSSPLLAADLPRHAPDDPSSGRDGRPSDRTAPAALADVYREHHRFVWRSLSRLGVSDDALSDASHDVFMVVARRLSEFEGRSSMRTWLFAIAMRVAWAARRDAARDHARRERLVPADPRSPHEHADAARTLRDLLQHLDDDQRAVFVMAELEGMTVPEIAMVVGCKVPTVYSRLRLARAKLARVVARTRAVDRAMDRSMDKRSGR